MGANGWMTMLGGAIVALGQYCGTVPALEVWGGWITPLGTLLTIWGARRATGKLIMALNGRK